MCTKFDGPSWNGSVCIIFTRFNNNVYNVKCDLDLWPISLKINGVHALVIHVCSMCTKFDGPHWKGSVCIVFTSFVDRPTDRQISPFFSEVAWALMVVLILYCPGCKLLQTWPLLSCKVQMPKWFRHGFRNFRQGVQPFKKKFDKQKKKKTQQQLLSTKGEREGTSVFYCALVNLI